MVFLIVVLGEWSEVMLGGLLRLGTACGQPIGELSQFLCVNHPCSCVQGSRPLLLSRNQCRDLKGGPQENMPAYQCFGVLEIS